MTATGDGVVHGQSQVSSYGPAEPVGYVVSRYPLTSHTFILREVLALRRRGVRVDTFSVRRTDPKTLLSADERTEFDRTSAIMPISAVRLVAVHAFVALGAPSAYLKTLSRAIRRSGRGRARLWGLFYFAEAIVLWQRCHRSGVRHLHAHLANQSCDLAHLACTYGTLRDPEEGWWWSFTMHGPTEFFDVERFHLAEKVEQADLVVCISDFCRSQLMALVGPDHWDRLVVVHCGVDLSRYPLREAPASPGPAPFQLLSVGRLVPEKGQALLLEAVRLLKDREVPVSLTLAGDGQDRPRLEARSRALGLEGIVRFVGSVSQDTMPELFAAADIFCLASFAEGVPVVLMEALASGVPVITTAIAGVPELVSDGLDGFVVAPGRADLIADAVQRLADPAVRTRMGVHGRQTVQAHFDSDACAEELATLFAAFEGRVSPGAGE
jgi:colanic acid/amylovoran biosynthesis glycosyltransferase